LDPDSLNPDLDPGFAESGFCSRPIVFIAKFAKIYSQMNICEKNYFYRYCFCTVTPKEDIQSQGGAFSPLERYSNINLIFFSLKNLRGPFGLFGSRLPNPDPDPLTQFNQAIVLIRIRNTAYQLPLSNVYYYYIT
jgi:hypothetical protein